MFIAIFVYSSRRRIRWCADHRHDRSGWPCTARGRPGPCVWSTVRGRRPAISPCCQCAIGIKVVLIDRVDFSESVAVFPVRIARHGAPLPDLISRRRAGVIRRFVVHPPSSSVTLHKTLPSQPSNSQTCVRSKSCYIHVGF